MAPCPLPGSADGTKFILKGLAIDFVHIRYTVLKEMYDSLTIIGGGGFTSSLHPDIFRKKIPMRGTVKKDIRRNF